MANIETSYLDIARRGGEHKVPIYTATPDAEFPNDPSDLVIFGQGIGEVGASQRRIVARLADTLGRRVVGYEAGLSAQIQSPWDDAVGVSRETHLRVVESVTNSEHSVIGHSLFGLTAGAVLPEMQEQITKLTLIAPATVTPEAVVSEEWREMMRSLSFERRAELARTYEGHWRRNTLGLMAGFLAVGLVAETVRGITNPLRSMRAGYDLARDVTPGFTKLYAAFGVLANVSSVPELVQAQERGIEVNIIVGAKDPVFSADKMRQAIAGTNLQGRLTVIDEGRGQGHSNMATLSGERQLDVAVGIHKGISL